MFSYTATTYFSMNEINQDSSNDLEDLFITMLARCQGKFGDLSGMIKDNRTHQIIRSFRMCATE